MEDIKLAIEIKYHEYLNKNNKKPTHLSLGYKIEELLNLQISKEYNTGSPLTPNRKFMDMTILRNPSDENDLSVGILL